MDNNNLRGNINVGRDTKGVTAQNISNSTINQHFISDKLKDEILAIPLVKGSPYRGLDKFRLEDKDKFFGRDQVTKELLIHLEQYNLLLLLGASGSGKSSLIQAGLIPQLTDKQEFERLVNLTFVPYENPFREFCDSLKPHYRSWHRENASLLENGSINTLSHTYKKLKNDDPWIIFIDQFEELFTLTPKETRDKFISSLVELTDQNRQNNSLKLIITMRSDFFGRLSVYPEFVDLLKGINTVLLTDMKREEIRSAITKPAARNGVVFEQGLVDKILDDFDKQAGSLPLLQYNLDLLWKTSDITNRKVTCESYQSIGGVSGSLQQQADSIYFQKLTEAEQSAAKQIFLELVDITNDEPVSRPG